LANIGKQLERKEFALLHRCHPYFGLAIKEIEGKDPDFKKFFEKYMLTKYSLRNVYSNFKKDLKSYDLAENVKNWKSTTTP
jgi:hypothetical protein